MHIGPTLATTGELTREIFGNIPTTAQAIFYLLAGAALVIFSWGMHRRIRLWRLGRVSAGVLTVRGAWRHLVRDVLFQRRVLGRPLAGIAHALLFSGFVVLLVGTTLIAVEHLLSALLGREATNPVFHRGIYFAIYELVTDTFGLALLAGCVMFARRRLKRPASLAHDWLDWAVLVVLTLLGVTGYLLEGLRIIREQTPHPGYSFVGLLAAWAFEAAAINPSAGARVHYCLWWIHGVMALGLVAAFPYTRLLHSLAGAIRLAAGPAPLGVMTKLSLEEVEESGVVGVGQVQHFSRQQLLELDACVSCGRCEEACPAFEAGKPLSPRDVVQDIRGHLNVVGPLILAQTKNAQTTDKVVGEAGALHGSTIAAETLWSCTTCSACVDVCPLDVNPLGLITDMRRHLIGESQLRGSAATSLQKTSRSGNPWGLSPQDRLAWAAGLDVPTATRRPDFDVLYWVGCAAAYDRRLHRVAQSVARLLTAAQVRFAVLGAEERCTGESARRMGDEFLFQQLATQNIETLNRHGVQRGQKKMVSHCPHCVNSFKHDYPQLGGHYDIVHHTELLADLAAAGRLPIDRAAWSGIGANITYHDPCYLARIGGVTEPPRRLIQLTLATGSGLVEMPRHGRQTACCGAGGGRMWFDDAPTERIGNSRVKEALGTGADTIAVSCPFCLIMTADGTLAQDSNVRVRDVAELLAEAFTAPERGAQNR